MDEFRRTLVRSIVLATIVGFSAGGLLGVALSGADCPHAVLSREDRL